MAYQVGDVVVVRPDLQPNREYDGVTVVEEMCAFRGMAVTITDTEVGMGIKIDLDHGDWVWSAPMFCGTIEEYETRNVWTKPFTVNMLDDLLDDREVIVSVQSKDDAEALLDALAARDYRCLGYTGFDYDHIPWEEYGEDTVYWLSKSTVDYSDISVAQQDNYDGVIKYTFQSVVLDDIEVQNDGLTLF